MAELTKERLKALSNRENVGAICSDEISAMARQLLASMEQEPVAWMTTRDGDGTFPRLHLEEAAADCWVNTCNVAPPIAKHPLYAAPQLPQPAVVDADDNFYSWFGREWHENYQHNQYTTAAKQMLGVMAESSWRAGRSAAMLQGAEPVRQLDELQVIVLHMGQAMSVFEALKKELISEHVRHAELGAMGAVNVQTWTSVIGGISLQYEASNGGCTLRVIPAAPHQEAE